MQTSHTRRGAVESVTSAYDLLVAAVKRDADGLVTEIRCGDGASTTTGFNYDDLRRLRNLTTYPAKPSSWPTTPSPDQLASEQLLLRQGRQPDRDNGLEDRKRVDDVFHCDGRYCGRVRFTIDADERVLAFAAFAREWNRRVEEDGEPPPDAEGFARFHDLIVGGKWLTSELPIDGAPVFHGQDEVSWVCL